MLTEVCDFVHNYFEHETFTGSFTVADGTIDLDSLVANGQRFRIQGSALNDGIYTYRDGVVYNDDGDAAEQLLPETFDGVVTAMSVPRSMDDLVSRIKDWVAKNQDVLDSPYTSESFGGYSYSKAAGSGSNAGGAFGWQDMFRARLNAYRKIS